VRRHRAVASTTLAALLATGLVALPQQAAAQEHLDDFPDAETFLVSRTDTGTVTETYLTSDGQKVAFTSTAADLVGGDTNGVADVFLSKAQQGSPDPFSAPALLVSKPDITLGEPVANGPSGEPVVSADGRYVAFSSTATNLVAEPTTEGRRHVYVHDTRTGVTFRVQSDTEPNGSSYQPDLSDDGRYLVFTSEATDLPAGPLDGNPVADTNGAPDAFIADLDSNGDGVLGDITITRVVYSRTLPGGTRDIVISGNGERVAFTAYGPSLFSDFELEDPPVSYVYTGSVASGAHDAEVGLRGAREPSIDASGEVIAFVDDLSCDEPDDILGGDAVGVRNLRTGVRVYLGWNDVNRIVGDAHNPQVSADGSMVVWETTHPKWEYLEANDPPQEALDEPVVRFQPVSWFDAYFVGEACEGIGWEFWTEVGTGTSPSISASGRTVALAGPTALSGASTSATAVDRHNHEGLWVSATNTEVASLGFVTEVNIADIPLTQLRNYASVLADAPIHRLPIHRLPIHRLPIHRLPIHRLLVDDAPIHRLPIHRLPIHRLPIHRLDIPGGWTELLAPTPFAGELIYSVTLADVLAWVEETLADGSGATPAQIAAAQRIRTLNLEDVDLSASGIDGLSLASFVLGNAPLAQVPVPGSGPVLQRWQALLDRQGIELTLDAQSVLAEVDSAGLDIGRSRVDEVPVRDLPLALTLMDRLLVSELFLENTPLGELEVSSLDPAARTALFGANAPTGTLGAHRADVLPGATVADLAAGAPTSVTLGTLLFSLIDAGSYPWEQIEATALPHNAINATAPVSCGYGNQCDPVARFAFTFDAGPGEPTVFPAPTATITLPPGTTRSPDDITIWGSGPGSVWLRSNSAYTGPVVQDGEVVRFPLPDTPSGTSFVLGVPYTASLAGPGEFDTRARLSSGGITSPEWGLWIPLSDDFQGWDDPRRNRLPDGTWEMGDPEPMVEGRIYYEWITPAYRRLTDFGEPVYGPADDEDYYLVNPPGPGERLILSTNATDGQIAVSLFTPETGAPPVAVENAGPAPGVPVSEPGGPAGGAQVAGSDVSAALPGHELVDQMMAIGADVAQIEVASADLAAASEPLLVRVTSGNGQPTSSLYSLRVRYVEEPVEQSCTPWTAPPGADGQIGTSDPVTATTNTIYLMDTERFGDTHGAEAAQAVLDALSELDGIAGVQGAVLSVDASPLVRQAREALDANPCSMAARRGLVSAINTYVRQQIGGNDDNIRSVVLVGGDDILPHVPVPQRTAQFNEASHAPSLRLSERPDGSPCPETLEPGQPDPCATPLSAAAATNHILTDDPYGLATAYESLAGFFYVPTVAVGRLIETPEEIQATVSRFVTSEGVLPADSSLTAGYGAWAELPDHVTDQLSWRPGISSAQLSEPWDRTQVESALFPAGDGPRVVSVNTHADETRMLPGVPGAAEGRFSNADLLEAGTWDEDQLLKLSRSLVFLIGCHAAQNLPGAYYGDVPDWADVFSAAGGYVGNTGFGLANNVTTALSERLLTLYAAWLGAETGGGPVTAGEALTYAKQSYLGELGRYSGYDEKVLMQTVYYGLPMYRIAAPAKPVPLPAPAPNLEPVDLGPGGIATASLENLPLTFQTRTGEDENGREVTYVTANDQDPMVVANQPILPKVVYTLPPDPNGLVPRGAVITALTSERTEGVTPAIGEPGLGAGSSTTGQRGSAFPSSFATVTRQETPDGVVDLLVVTPGRVQTGPDGTGVIERFTQLSLDVTYSDADHPDTTPPFIEKVLPEASGGRFEVHADGTGSDIVRVVLLAVPEGEDEWQEVPMSRVGSSNVWEVQVPFSSYRWIVQVVDEGGNVAVDTARGLMSKAEAQPPSLGDAGDDVTLLVGERLLRVVDVEVPDDLAVGELLTGTWTMTRPGSTNEIVRTGDLVVARDASGNLRATLDHAVTTPGVFDVRLQVCRSGRCSESAVFGLTVEALNNPPSVSVVITSDTEEITPTSVLTAVALPSDPDDDPVTLNYAWSRNGLPIVGATGTTLDLNGLAGPGDSFTVTVTPHDGKTAGHDGVAIVALGEPASTPPPGPTITASAVAGGKPYVQGEWSRVPVTVTFSCTTSPPGAPCPEPVTVSDDTPTDGQLVTRSVTDGIGRTATAQFLVRVDGTPPELTPTVSPATVPVGGTATASANAVDAASGVQGEECDPVDTSTVGTFHVECRATDVAGNPATGFASYEVVPAQTGELVVTVEATSRGQAYQEGTWANGPVQVRFRCESDVTVTSCPKPVTISQDTGPDGRLVTGTAKDSAGRTVTVEFLVRVDKTPPKLDPTVTPSTVPVGGVATASPNATDTGAGVASATCDPVDTSKTGTKHVWCYATDHAGNTAKAKASYKVVKAGGGSNGSGGSGGLAVTLKATAGKSTYQEGTWARQEVKVTFTCTSDVKVTTCPKTVTVSKDTGSQGVLVTGTAKDKDGRTATASIVVKVDRTPPKLSPKVLPEKVPVGGDVTVAANATDKASGVASWSCGTPSTAKQGKFTVTCQATDAAGNSATAKASYTVVAKSSAPPKDDKPKSPKPPKDEDDDDKKKDKDKKDKDKGKKDDKDKSKDKDKNKDKKPPKEKKPRRPDDVGRVMQTVLNRLVAGWS
jgi:hypothetical protein